MLNSLKIVFGFASPSGWEFKRNPPNNPNLGRKILAGYNARCDRSLEGYCLMKSCIAKEPRGITITRYVETAKRFIKDDVNLREGCKPIVDALVRAKLLVDDDTKWLKFEVYKQAIGAGAYPNRTEVKIEW